MKLDTGIKPYMSRERPGIGGVQDVYRFDNRYGASVISGYGSYGLELAVIYWYSNDEWHITYESGITDDVIGYLDFEGLMDLLVRIRELPPVVPAIESA